MGRHHDRKYGMTSGYGSSYGRYGMPALGNNFGNILSYGLVPLVALGGVSIALLTLFKHKIWSAGTYSTSTASTINTIIYSPNIFVAFTAHPEFWGPSQWKCIHSAAANAITPSKRRHFKKYMRELLYMLPCDSCRNNLKLHLTALPLNDFLSNPESLLYWTFLLHNRISQQLGKPEANWAEVRATYLNY